jgi:hypothetical protein
MAKNPAICEQCEYYLECGDHISLFVGQCQCYRSERFSEPVWPTTEACKDFQTKEVKRELATRTTFDPFHGPILSVDLPENWGKVK